MHARPRTDMNFWKSRSLQQAAGSLIVAEQYLCGGVLVKSKDG